MLTAPVRSVTFFDALFQLDQQLSEACRSKRCPDCKGPLYLASYPRKPRGGPDELPVAYQTRLSLCCGREGCRKRTLPPSCLFMGRRVYLAASILVTTVLRQRSPRSAELKALVELLGVAPRTIRRWLAHFASTFPKSPLWLRLRGLVNPSVGNDQLPSALLALFERSSTTVEQALTRCLYFLTTGDTTHIANLTP